MVRGAVIREFYFTMGLIMGSKGRLLLARRVPEIDLLRDWRIIQHLFISYVLAIPEEVDGVINLNTFSKLMTAMDGSSAVIKKKTLFVRSRQVNSKMGFIVYQENIPRKKRKGEGLYDEAELRMTEEGRKFISIIVKELLQNVVISGGDLMLSSLLSLTKEIENQDESTQIQNNDDTLEGGRQDEGEEKGDRCGSDDFTIPLGVQPRQFGVPREYKRRRSKKPL